jgi:hypothetical protein
MPAELDHILLGVSDLERGIAWFEVRSGVRAVIGGVHPGRGTRNALAALGPRSYLEIFAPDPAQADVSNPMVDRLRKMTEPGLVGWAIHTSDLKAVLNKTKAAGIAIENPRDGSRNRPDGKLLRWRSFALENDFSSVFPFFIEWAADSVHPSQDAPAGCSLKHFSIESPAENEVKQTAHKLGLDVEIRKGSRPALHARIEGRKGVFELS